MSRRRVLRLGAIGLALVLLSATAWIGSRLLTDDPVRGVRVTASSAMPGFGPQQIVHRQGGDSHGWRSRSETVGAWIQLSWQSRRQLHSLEIVQPASAANIEAGVLEFSDGSAAQVSLQGTRTVVDLEPRSITTVRFVITAVRSGSGSVSVASIELDRSSSRVVRDQSGDAAAAATVDISGRQGSGSSHEGSGWTIEAATGRTLQYKWAQPRELVAIEVAGAASGSTLSQATVKFDGGGTIEVGAVSKDPKLSTMVGFMPRSVRSLTITVNRIDGSTPLVFSALHLWERGHDAANVPRSSSGVTVQAEPAASCDDPPSLSVTTLQVLCPENGSLVGDSFDLAVAVPSGAYGVRAEVWPAIGQKVPEPVQVSGTGTVRVPLRLAGLASGPVTVHLVPLGVVGPSAVPVEFQLMHGLGTSARTPTSSAARGRTLVFDDEFDGPLSASRESGDDRYAAGKPEPWGYSDFGDAIFAEPSASLGNLGTLADRYLRVNVAPIGKGSKDPQGYGRTHTGGIIASAHSGGGGFSAQYGYFEARMLVPANPGTWPAFWMLSSPNLIRERKTTAEIDAVELYGHDPTGACHTTHTYTKRKSTGGVARCGTRFESDDRAAQWHRYGVAIDPAQIRYYIDGRQVARASQVEGGGDPMFFLLNLSLGGGWPVHLEGTQGRAQMLVDWVRVYA